jgi:hypothetical protein
MEKMWFGSSNYTDYIEATWNDIDGWSHSSLTKQRKKQVAENCLG